MRKALYRCLLLASLLLSGCGYNAMQQQDEAVKAAWADVVNQYQRRADLIPNLVSTVQGYATHEQQVLVGVTEARARALSVQATPEMINDPAQFRRFQEAQGQLTMALHNLMGYTEAYPQLRADAGFRDLQAQLEGTENRITVARNRYIAAVQTFNTTVRSFPTNLTARMFGMQVRPSFTVADEQAISTAPRVDFGNQPHPAPPGAQAAAPQPAVPHR